jgi:hypothetical protein
MQKSSKKKNNGKPNPTTHQKYHYHDQVSIIPGM